MQGRRQWRIIFKVLKGGKSTKILKDTRTPIFRAALFTIARSWKQAKCPSTHEWIKKWRPIGTMEYYSVMKKNETMPSAATRMDVEMMVLSKSERHIVISRDLAYMWSLKYETANS